MKTIIIELTEDGENIESKIRIGWKPTSAEMANPTGILAIAQGLIACLEMDAQPGTMKMHAKACLKDGTVIAESDLSE